MRTQGGLLFLALCTGLAAPAAAQSIDLGRGTLRVHVPDDYSINTATPLIVLLHGYTSSGEQQESYMRFGNLVDSHDFLLVHPDGTRQTTDDNPRFWNASAACCNFAGSTVDDSGYVLDVINEVKSLFSVDPHRVYLVGHSNGGFMSFRAAHDHSEAIAAIASLAGAAATEVRPAPPNPVHVLQIHGTNDRTILYEGGDIQDDVYPGAVESVERWARYNGCTVHGAVQSEEIDLDSGLEGDDTTVTRYDRGCAGGSAELWTINGGGHVPALSDSFTRHVVEWLLAHPKS